MIAQLAAAIPEPEFMFSANKQSFGARSEASLGPSSGSTELASVKPLNDQKPEVDTLFFDGQCPLCAREIEQLRQTRGRELAIVDIHDLNDGLESDLHDGPDNGLNDDVHDHRSKTSLSPSKDQLLRTLHLRRADGQWLTSADANVAAWEGTRHGRLLRVLRWPVIRHVADLVYTLWARWRYQRLYGDQFHETTHAPDKQ